MRSVNIKLGYDCRSKGEVIVFASSHCNQYYDIVNEVQIPVRRRIIQDEILDKVRDAISKL